MKKKIDTTKLLEVLRDFPNNKAGFYAEKLETNRVTTHALLRSLETQWYIKKSGKTPHTVYSILPKVWRENIINPAIKKAKDENFIIIEYRDQKILETFYKYLPDGTLLQGKKGLIDWCRSRWIESIKWLHKFISVSEHIEKLRDKNGFLDATSDFQKGRNSTSVDELYFLDQYIYAEFGRWPLAELTFYAKLSQNMKLLDTLLGKIIDPLLTLVQEKKIDALAITPPSIDRKNQLMTLITKKLTHTKLPFIDIYKYFPNSIPVAQKTLKSREQREQNARNTIQIDLESPKYNRILLIDDFVGSGATLDITAEKLKSRKIAKYIVWCAIIGNLNLDYEVINEV